MTSDTAMNAVRARYLWTCAGCGHTWSSSKAPENDRLLCSVCWWKMREEDSQ